MCTNEGNINLSCAHVFISIMQRKWFHQYQQSKQPNFILALWTQHDFGNLGSGFGQQTYVAGLYRWMTVYPSWYIQTTMTAKEIIAYLTSSEVLLYQAYVTLAMLAILVLLLQRSFYIIWLCNLWSFIVADECYFRNSSCAIN